MAGGFIHVSGVIVMLRRRMTLALSLTRGLRLGFLLLLLLLTLVSRQMVYVNLVDRPLDTSGTG